MSDVDFVEALKSSQGDNPRTTIFFDVAGHAAQRARAIACEPGRLSGWQERKAKAMFLEHLEGGIQISAVAKACCLSRSHFSRAFKVATGHSPSDWLQLARLTRAKQLLEQNDSPICQVGLACGFVDQSHFSRMFSRKFGMTPRKWRAQEQAQP